MSELEAKQLLHELHVHQIELEMQNEELRRAQVDLAGSFERYADLYEHAPVGYLSVNLNGIITRANVVAAHLLGVQRHLLPGRPLSAFVGREDLARYQAMRRRLVVAGLSESAEFVLQPAQGQDPAGRPFWARLEVITRHDLTEGALVWQVAINNIDTQKRAELTLQRVNEELEEQVERRTKQLAESNRLLVEEIGRRREAEAGLREREEWLEHRVAERTAALAALLVVARELGSTLDIGEVLSIIVRELARIVEYHGCGIFLLDGKVLTLAAYDGPPDRKELVQSQATLDESPLLKMVIQSKAPLIIADMNANTPLTREWHKRAGSFQRYLLGASRSWLAAPMLAQGQPVGVLRLDHREPGHFAQEHVDLVLTLASQAATAVVNARLFSQVQRVAAVEERQRLARELHDSVAQTFYSIGLASHSAKAQLAPGQALVGHRIDHIVELAGAGLTEMKTLIFDLQAEGIRRDGLVLALRHQLDAIAARNDIRIHAVIGNEPEAAIEAKEAMYGIAREALQNVVRHAGATELWLQLDRADDALHMEVRDNGRGFAPEAEGMMTMGLRSMRERAAACAGSVEVVDAPGEGAVVRARIPVMPPAASASKLPAGGVN